VSARPLTPDGDRDVARKLLATPFVASWVGRSRVGADRFDSDWGRRSAAWAHWAVTNLVELTGANERAYPAILLEGRFHDPRGNGPLVRPHLEIAAAKLAAPDASFADRLALAGNALAFPWWLPAEVTAAKRAVFNTGGGDVGDVVSALVSHRNDLVATAAAVHRQVAGAWSTIEALLFDADDGLSGAATGPFSTEEIAELFPEAATWRLQVTYDDKLRAAAGVWASRRVGVWQLHGRIDGRRVALGVVTPRLTANSQFIDPLFAIDKESPAALLVRTLILRRIAAGQLGVAELQGLVHAPAAPVRHAGAHLRAVVSQVGAKLPEASTEAAVHFLRTHPDPDAAWAAMAEWAQRTRTLLTVSPEGFREAHKRASRFVRRTEDPERDDVNVLLPLGWDDRSRVVRVTFSRPPADPA
jgi:hypothetical protein